MDVVYEKQTEIGNGRIVVRVTRYHPSFNCHARSFSQLALKGPRGISEINGLHAKTFQSHTRFYNDLQIGCPI